MRGVQQRLELEPKRNVVGAPLDDCRGNGFSIVIEASISALAILR